MRTDRETERKAAMAMGIAVSIFGLFFVVIWCVIAASIGAWFMILFAIPTMGFLVFRLVIMLRQDKKKDPWEMPDRHYTNDSHGYSSAWGAFDDASRKTNTSHTPRFCHSCSYWVHNDFQFCPRCGRRIF